MCDLHIQSMCGYKNRTVRVQYSHTILVTKFASCTLYMDPCVVHKNQSILWPLDWQHDSVVLFEPTRVGGGQCALAGHVGALLPPVGTGQDMVSESCSHSRMWQQSCEDRAWYQQSGNRLLIPCNRSGRCSTGAVDLHASSECPLKFSLLISPNSMLWLICSHKCTFIHLYVHLKFGFWRWYLS